MRVFDFVGFLALAGVAAVGVARYQPAVVDQLARQTGVDGRTGWLVYAAAVGWVFLPVLFGAQTGESWVFGAAIAGVGAYLVVVAAGSLDEYRLLAGVDHVDPGRVTPGDPVATSSEPDVDETARTPFSGIPAVHTDWLVQRRERVGFRRAWNALAGGVESTPFSLGDGAVEVRAGDHRVVSDAETTPVYDPDNELPEAAASFLAAHPDLPDPGAREEPLRLFETFVPAEEPVTVVGTPRQADEPGTVVVDEAPPDDLLGTDGDGPTGEAVLVRGDADGAEATLRKRVYWVGAAGAAMVVGGQALSFAMSSATPGAFL